VRSFCYFSLVNNQHQQLFNGRNTSRAPGREKVGENMIFEDTLKQEDHAPM
jgi:hypothetical protein